MSRETSRAATDRARFEADDPETNRLDQLALDLQRLKTEAGPISYAEIALRVADQREAAGLHPAAARVARSSIHAMFVTGRRRMNADLLEEIVLALGADEESAKAWRQRCIDAQQQPSGEPQPPAPVPPRSARESVRSFPATTLAAPRPFPPQVTLLIVAACIGINYFGNTLNSKFELPLFLDMIGTAVAAIALGPWHGALVGLTSNTLMALGANPVSIAFALVNIAGALVWGYGVHAWRLRRPWWRFFVLNVLVALVCSLVAVPINVLLFGGVAEGHAAVGFVDALVESGRGLWRAVFSVNLQISITDKIISGYLALGLVWLLQRQRSAA